MILNGCNILTIVLVRLSRHTNDIEWLQSTYYFLVGLTGHTNDIEWVQYSHFCFSWTHRTHD